MQNKTQTLREREREYERKKKEVDSYTYKHIHTSIKTKYLARRLENFNVFVISISSKAHIVVVAQYGIMKRSFVSLPLKHHVHTLPSSLIYICIGFKYVQCRYTSLYTLLGCLHAWRLVYYSTGDRTSCYIICEHVHASILKG